VLTSFIIGALINAGFALQGPGFPIGLTGTMEGILLFCVLGAEIMARYHLRFRSQPSRTTSPPEGPMATQVEPASVAAGESR
jgi:ABC-type uncharacterized transport system permease subunit